jgi:CheY-like chemotaxis protein
MLQLTQNLTQNFSKAPSLIDALQLLADFIQITDNVELSYWILTNNSWECTWKTSSQMDKNLFGENFITAMMDCIRFQNVIKFLPNNNFTELLLVPIRKQQEGISPTVLLYGYPTTKNITEDRKVIAILLANLLVLQMQQKQNNLPQLTTTTAGGILENFATTSVLLVEDMPSYQVVLGGFLQGFGIQPVIVSTGKEAIEKIIGQDFTIILINMQLSDIDGFALAQKIRTTLKYTNTILIMTTENTDTIQHKAVAIGIQDSITKPITHNTIHKILQKYGSRAEKLPDLSFLEMAANNNQAFIKNMLLMTITEFEQFERKIVVFVAENRKDEIHTLYHKIKPHIESYKLEVLKNLLLEVFAIENKETQMAILAKIQMEIHKICSFFQQKIEQANGLN